MIFPVRRYSYYFDYRAKIPFYYQFSWPHDHLKALTHFLLTIIATALILLITVELLSTSPDRIFFKYQIPYWDTLVAKIPLSLKFFFVLVIVSLGLARCVKIFYCIEKFYPFNLQLKSNVLALFCKGNLLFQIDTSKKVLCDLAQTTPIDGPSRNMNVPNRLNLIILKQETNLLIVGKLAYDSLNHQPLQRSPLVSADITRGVLDVFVLNNENYDHLYQVLNSQKLIVSPKE